MNKVYIATSIDGYIADKNGGIDWLHEVENPEGSDLGFMEFMSGVDAIIMGRTTYETVLGFDVDWPYPVPVFVLSTTLRKVADGYEDKVFLVNGSIENVLQQVQDRGHKNIYIDGGRTIQSFLQKGLIDELCITTIPIVLGGGSPLFCDLETAQRFKLEKSEVLLNQLVKNTYKKA